MRPSVSSSILLVGALGALSGCATATADDPADADAAQTHAFLRVDRVRDVGDEAATRARASATFLRTRDAADPNVLARIVGAIPSLPSPGECAAVDGSDATLALHTLTPVELAQAGDVTIVAGEASTPLVARAYPDVAHLVSGVVYTTPDVTDGLLARDRRVVFHVAGSADVPPFDAEVEVPMPIESVRVDGVALGEIAPARGASPLAVSWQPVPDDDVYVDVAAGSGDRVARFRCTPKVGASDVVLVDPATVGASVVGVTVHRVRSVAIDGAPVTTGEVRFDTAVTGRVSFEPAG